MNILACQSSRSAALRLKSPSWPFLTFPLECPHCLGHHIPLTCTAASITRKAAVGAATLAAAMAPLAPLNPDLSAAQGVVRREAWKPSPAGGHPPVHGLLSSPLQEVASLRCESTRVLMRHAPGNVQHCRPMPLQRF